jgi:multiple sugar transport system ATP-binding protein
MDEPLSNLDAKLRVQMRSEVSRLQSRLGTTTVYVTHDQIEAMTLGDRVAVMRAGVLQQVGSPAELYNEPANLFVAGFIGSPAMNFMPATIDGDRVQLPFGEVTLGSEARERLGRTEGRRDVIAGIRPESFEDVAFVGDARDRGSTFRAKIDLVESMGSELYAHFTVEQDRVESQELAELAEDSGVGEVPGGGGEGQVVARLDAASKARRNEETELWVDMDKIHFFDPDDGKAISGGRG